MPSWHGKNRSEKWEVSQIPYLTFFLEIHKFEYKIDVLNFSELFELPIKSTKCGHSFCQKCLISLWKRSLEMWQCPECRKIHECSIFSLSRNYALEKIVEKIKNQPKEPKPKNCEKKRTRTERKVSLKARGLKLSTVESVDLRWPVVRNKILLSNRMLQHRLKEIIKLQMSWMRFSSEGKKWKRKNTCAEIKMYTKCVLMLDIGLIIAIP